MNIRNMHQQQHPHQYRYPYLQPHYNFRPTLLRPGHNMPKRPSSTWKHMLSLMATSLLCSLGVIWQLYAVTDAFCRYSLVSEVYMEKLDNILPPSFSICVPFIELMDWSDAWVNVSKDNWYRMSEVDRNRVRQQIQSNLTIRQVFDSTPDIMQLMKSCQVRVNELFEISEDANLINVVKFVKDDLICYRLSNINMIRNQGSFRMSSLHLAYGSDPGILLSITLDRAKFGPNISKVVTFLHPSDVYPRGDGDFPFNFISKNGSPVFGSDGGSSYIGLTYTKMSLFYLPPPFRTKCHDYQGAGFESAYHCAHTCLTKKLLLLKNVTSFTTTFTASRPERMMDKYMLYDNKTAEGMFTDLFASCRNACPGKNCVKQIFSPALVSVRSSDDVTFVLYAMNGPEYMIYFKPSTSLTDLYVQILSVCGAWLGISCVDIIFNSCSLCMGCKHVIRKQVMRCKNYLK